MRLILAVLLVPLLAHAQDRVVSCRFLGFQTGDTTSLINVAAGTEMSCPLESSGISAPVSLVATNNVLNFVTAKDRKPACAINVPPNMRQALIVITPNGSDPAKPWRGFAIEDSKKNFPDGGALVVNLHSSNIRFVIGEHKYVLKPGDQYGMEMPKQVDDFNMATVAFEFSNKDQWAKASESRQRFTPGLRYLMIAYTDPASQRPRLSVYQDDPFKALAVSGKPATP
jgi:hypothetical protein